MRGLGLPRGNRRGLRDPVLRREKARKRRKNERKKFSPMPHYHALSENIRNVWDSIGRSGPSYTRVALAGSAPTNFTLISTRWAVRTSYEDSSRAVASSLVRPAIARVRPFIAEPSSGAYCSGSPMPLSNHRLVELSKDLPAPLNPWRRPKGRKPAISWHC